MLTYATMTSIIPHGWAASLGAEELSQSTHLVFWPSVTRGERSIAAYYVVYLCVFDCCGNELNCAWWGILKLSPSPSVAATMLNIILNSVVTERLSEWCRRTGCGLVATLFALHWTAGQVDTDDAWRREWNVVALSRQNALRWRYGITTCVLLFTYLFRMGH